MWHLVLYTLHTIYHPLVLDQEPAGRSNLGTIYVLSVPRVHVEVSIDNVYAETLVAGFLADVHHEIQVWSLRE